jgi:hypothetical protein
MKTTFTIYVDGHAEIVIRDDAGAVIHSYDFDNKKEASAFMKGMACMKSIVNSAVQSIPTDYRTVIQTRQEA